MPLGRYPAGLEYRTAIHHVRLYNARVLTQHVESFGFRRISLAGVSWLRMRWLHRPVLRRVDQWLADRMPQFCGNLVGVFQKQGAGNAERRPAGS